MKTIEELLTLYRSVLDHIHKGGNIFYDAARMQAYCIVAKLASEETHAEAKAVRDAAVAKLKEVL